MEHQFTCRTKAILNRKKHSSKDVVNLRLNDLQGITYQELFVYSMVHCQQSWLLAPENEMYKVIDSTIVQPKFLS